MINGRLHRDIILGILMDKKAHFVREFLDAGLCEYRQPIDQLRKKGFIVDPIEIDGRPAWILRGRWENAKQTEMFQTQETR